MDQSKVLAYLKKRFPDNQNLRVSNFENIAAGWETQIHGFSLDFIKDEKDNHLEWIIRQYPGRHAAYKSRNS